jgi:hypothetical protein
MRRLKAELRKNFLLNFCSLEHAWYLPIGDYLHNREISVYDGAAGDYLTNAGYGRLTAKRHALYQAGRYHELASDLLLSEGYSEWYLRGVIHRNLLKCLDLEIALEHLASELKKYQDSPNPIVSFFLVNRVRRSLVLPSCRLLDSHATVFFPYLDHELHDFLLSLPVETFLEGAFHDEAIQQAYPRFADIPFALKILPTSAPSLRYSYGIAFDLILDIMLNLNTKSVYLPFLVPRICRYLMNPVYANLIPGFAILPTYMIQLERAKAEITSKRDNGN